MTTRLSDIIVPEVFFPYMLKETETKTAFFQSGIMRTDPVIAGKLAGGGETFQMPTYADLSDANEASIGSDNPADVITADKISAFKDICRRQVRSKAWSDMDLVRELSGSDPMQAIASRVAQWWGRSMQRAAISTVRGVVADNVANDASDMVNDIGTDAAGAPAAAELVSAEAILDTKQTLGDSAEKLAAIAMHSVVYTRLQKQNLIDFIPDSEGRVMFPTYLGYRVVVDDGLPAIAGTNRTKYHTYLFAEGALAWGESPVAVPVETDRAPEKGNGTGQETLFTRRQFVIHPYGIKWTETAVVGQFPTNAELQTATNWDRVYPERKQIPMAVLITNG